MADSQSVSQNSEIQNRRSRRKNSPRLFLNVTAAIIDAAVPKDSKHCMIADAVKAAFPAAVAVEVDLQAVRFSDPDKGLRYIYLTPRMAQLALLDFDDGKKPPPFEFKLHRAVQIVSMKRRTPDGRQRKVHRFGRKTVQPEGERGIPTVIGGRSPPVAFAELASAELASAELALMGTESLRPGRVRKRRRFGLRGFMTPRERMALQASGEPG